jgi:hypothetical protein
MFRVTPGTTDDKVDVRNSTPTFKVPPVRDTCSCIQEAGALSPALHGVFVERRTSLSLIAFDSMASQNTLQLF